MNIKRKFWIVFLLINLLLGIVCMNHFEVRAIKTPNLQVQDGQNDRTLTPEQQKAIEDAIRQQEELEKAQKEQEEEAAREADLNGIIDGMDGIGRGESDSNIGKVLQIVIGLIQVAGTGISLIMTTILGIKYMLASSADKAEIKKQAVPLVVGCVLLFAAVNLVAVVANIGVNL